jgi:transcriptional regulator with XRE-family HTH domain
MNFISEVRHKLNCSAREFAQFLDVSRQILARVERGNGVLPQITDDCIMMLGDAIREVEMEIEKSGNGSEENTIKPILHERNMAIQNALVRFRAELAAMPENFVRASNARKYYDKAISKAGKFEPKNIGWLRSQADLQPVIMKKNDELARHTLRVKIAQLELELAMNTEA